MARNEEKALTLFSKWNTFKNSSAAISRGGKSLVSNDISSLPEAEKIRREVVSNITKKISSIQNATLGEHRIRELNDEINSLMKKKHYWEIRIREMGGGDYKAKGRQLFDIEGREIPGQPGYRYYGAAKELPGLRELFAEKKDEVIQRKRNRVDLYKNITPDYYGFRDDEDGILVMKESIREKELIELSLIEYDEKKKKLLQDIERSGGVFGKAEYDEILAAENDDNDDDDNDDMANHALGDAGLPTHEDIEQYVVGQKKLNLLETYL